MRFTRSSVPGNVKVPPKSVFVVIVLLELFVSGAVFLTVHSMQMASGLVLAVARGTYISAYARPAI
jgi:hypothetical protein